MIPNMALKRKTKMNRRSDPSRSRPFNRMLIHDRL